MSESEEDENFELYGTPLEPLDEDNIPKKKPFTIEDQIATDEQGRRRFHGAFTGGFSAGFFNTVGSLEGWKPSEFKSSRSEKAGKKQQRPEDFMDDEDTGTFGIKPIKLKATSDYSQVNKRKRIKNNGPIPGDPVLFSLLEVVKETVGVRLLKKMGWKPGQGVGPRVSKGEKIKTKKERRKNFGKIYGCEIPEQFRRKVDSGSESEDSDTDLEIEFAPDDYDAFVYKPKDNAFGMGYSGLDKTSILGHVNLFNPPEFRLQERNNKKVSIAGQAFGVGAFEEEDEDIYNREDMTKYDFQLDTPGKKPKLSVNTVVISGVLEGFVPIKTKLAPKKCYPPPEIPKGFIPKHGARISRFEPLPETHKLYKYDRSKNVGRHDLTASERSKIINSENITINETVKSERTKILSSTEKVDISKEKNEQEKKILLEKARKITEGLTRTPCGTFKPFLSDEDKQKRYEIYLTLNKHNLKDKLSDIQPLSMSDWEKEREKSEFEQASMLFKPVTGLIFDKFVSSTNSTDDLDPLKPATKSVYEHGTPEMREAAKKKMFGALTRVVLPWTPHKLLCRRFNVPEPKISDDVNITAKRKNKFNIFDYYEAYQQNKTEQGPKSDEKNIPEKTNIDKNLDITDKSLQEIVNQDSIASTSKIIDNLTIIPPKESIVSNVSEEISNLDKTAPSAKISENNNFTNIEDNSNVNQLETKIQNTKESEILTVPTDPQAKKDLFKAIFLSSSESENESESEKEVQNKFTEMKKMVEESVITKPVTKESTRFTNRGFFSDLDLSKLNKSSENKNPIKPKDTLPEPNKMTEINKNETDKTIYGPQLPAQDKKQDWRPTFQKPNKTTVPVKIIPSNDDDEWVEINESKKKDKHHKKHKKHKEKHKKHKSKHKKRRKSHSD